MRLVSDAGQTAFMITHDVDEAILLADRILLMTNGPDARVAEVVVNTLAASRGSGPRSITLPGYYEMRNHIVDFLVTRSRMLAGSRPEGWTGRVVPEVRPAELVVLTTHGGRTCLERREDGTRPEDHRREEGKGLDLAAGR